ncbi:restriction endonuclease subunit S [Photobacterium arenosum]|uniref:restriction endonuclease subunit S n=1 Tax=Photobacterium arenosum TaxID=2774143 RepID=UPI0028892B92|nr:restriction endonuclease subunit S [Photobacterium arenosum]
MSCNWPQVKLGELVEITSSKRVKMADYVEKGVPFFRSKEVIERYKGNTITTELYITEEHYQAIKDKFGAPEEGHILLTSVGTLGIPYQVQANDKFYFKDGNLTWFKEFGNAIDAEYLFYWLTSPIAKRKFDEITIGSTQKALTIVALKGIEIDLPPKHVQKQVVQIVKSLDKKLANNRGVNQTLEQMAQAIFKSWFVDFDPVKAKMNGEQPEGMDAATASLFPEKLVESELGLIPEGWKVSSLSELIKLTGGGTPKRSEEKYWNGDIPWFSVKDVPSGSNVFVVDTDEKITELGLNKSSTKLLPKGTTIITARGTVGKLALVGTDMCMNQSCYGIRGIEVGDYYNYFNLKEAVSTLQRNTHGAVFDTITTKTFETYSMAFSGTELANEFDALVAPLLQKIEANVRQNIELAKLRDTLLPKLLSGEIELDKE